jgi:hypothetical protein
MGEYRIRIELPGMATPDPEIWPDDCTVRTMVERVTKEARERDRAFATEGKDWGIFLKRTNAALPREVTLAESGVQSGDVLLLKDEAEVRSRRDAYLNAARAAVAAGLVDEGEAKQLASARTAAGLEAGAARAFLAASGVDEGWLDRLIAEKEYWPEDIAGYRKALQGVPRDGNCPDDLHRALAHLRGKLKISPEVHRKLCKKVGFTDALSERLLVDLPPKEDGLAAYRKELEFLKKQPPQTPDEIKPLNRLQKQHKVSPADHQALAIEVGFSPQEAEFLWDGIPPRMVERENALDGYRNVLKAAWFDQTITPAEHAKLLAHRQQHKISAVDHVKVCKELKIPNEIAEALLKAPQAPVRRVWPALAAALVVTGAITAATFSMGGKLQLPGMKDTPASARPSAHASPDAPHSPAPPPHEDHPPLATPVAPHVEPTARPSARSRRGVVVVTSIPVGAAVLVDGEVRGVTPLELEESPGEHTIVVRAPGYFSTHTRIEFVAGERLSWTTTLRRRYR